MEVNIQTSVAQNRGFLSIMGSGLGRQIFQVSPREAFPEFEKKKAVVAAAGNVELITNRTPMRYHIFAHDVINVGVEENIAGQPIVYINKHDDGSYDVSIPFSNDMTKYSDVTKEAIKQAIKGDKTKIFSNPSKLSSFLNELNRAEITRVQSLIKELQKAEQGLLSAIAENEKKAKTYEDELVASSPKPDIMVPVTAGAEVEVNIHNEDLLTYETYLG